MFKKIGIIGGSGLDNPQILTNASDCEILTPYGSPSAPLRVGSIGGCEVAILARHGRQHTIPPTQVNYRANIDALRQVGCDCIVATTAVGSLREEIGRGDLVILDQFIDFTRRRALTFFESFTPGNPTHTPMADPFHSAIRERLICCCKSLNLKFHPQGTVITIEGPRFSTRAESRMFRLWGADVINMSVAPECALSNEAGIPYAAVAMSTDYDCWKEDEEAVSWEMVLKIFHENADKVTRLLTSVVADLSGK